MTLARAAPNAEPLRGANGELAALGLNRTLGADFQRVGGGVAPTGEEQTGIETAAGGESTPVCDLAGG